MLRRLTWELNFQDDSKAPVSKTAVLTSWPYRSTRESGQVVEKPAVGEIRRSEPPAGAPGGASPGQVAGGAVSNASVALDRSRVPPYHAGLERPIVAPDNPSIYFEEVAFESLLLFCPGAK